jgi:hypothetical protein
VNRNKHDEQAPQDAARADTASGVVQYSTAAAMRLHSFRRFSRTSKRVCMLHLPSIWHDMAGVSPARTQYEAPLFAKEML